MRERALTSFTVCMFILFNMKFVHEVHIKNKNKLKLKWNYRLFCTPTAVSMQSICARVHSHPGVYKIPTFNI